MVKRIAALLAGAITPVALLGALLVLSLPPAAAADEASGYPDRPVRIVVAFAPGGAADVLTRRLGEKLALRLNQPVVVENRAGGNTVIASEMVAASPADGYTLYSTNTTIIQIPFLYNTRYEEARDFVPVVQYAGAPLSMAVPADSPIRSVKDLVDYVKARPGKTSYGTAGAGGTQHILSEAFKRVTGVDSVHVPYKGEAILLNDFLGGRIDWYIATPITILPHVKSGKVRLLAITGDQRLPQAPEVPTFAEEGINDLAIVGWYGLFAPSKTPKPIVDKLSKEISQIIHSPDVTDYILAGALIPTGYESAEFGSKLPQFRESFKRMIKENDIKLE